LTGDRFFLLDFLSPKRSSSSVTMPGIPSVPLMYKESSSPEGGLFREERGEDGGLVREMDRFLVAPGLTFLIFLLLLFLIFFFFPSSVTTVFTTT